MKFLLPEGWRFAAHAAFLSLVTFGAPGVRAQAPPGPLSQAAPKDTPGSSQVNTPPPNVPRTKNLAGTWRLNVDDSDDPSKKLQQARGSQNGGQGGGRRGGGMGGGWPGGGGRGGYGGRGTGGGESDSERQKMQLFLQPAQQLTVSQKDPEIDVSDDDRKFAFYTDNRKIEKSKDPNHQGFLAKLDEFRLVAEGKDPHGNKYERSYEVLEGNQQLRETLFLKVGRNNTEISIHYVYDLVSPAPSQSPASH